jgi:Rhs element Vgr protein
MVKVENLKILIDGKMLEGYNFTKINLIQKIHNSSELRFTICKETLSEESNDIRFSLSRELLGKRVKCSFTTKRGDEYNKPQNDCLSFTGIIFNINVVRQNIKEETGMAIEVVAYSPDHLLNDNSHCYSYENVKLQDIVSQTLNPYKIPIQNSPRMEQAIPYIVQHNESNYCFLKRLATRFGEWLYYDGEKLVFGKINKSDCIELTPGYDTLDYQYSMNMQHLNFSHTHHNYLAYENTKVDAPSFTKGELHSMTDVVYGSSESLYEKATFEHLQVSSAENGFDETAFSVKAQGLGQKSQMLKCIGRTKRADLHIGSIIRIKENYETKDKEVEECEHDMLLICGIIHTIEGKVYENQFIAIPANCEYPPYTYGDCSPKANSQRAVVKDNKDPEKLGRVRVQFLWQQEQDANLMTPWIRIAQPHGGGDKGFYFIPEIEEEVIVGFENGNAEKPYVIGTLYHGKAKPENEWYSENDDIKAIRTRSGHTIEFHDTAGKEYIEIYDHGKRNFVLTFSTHEQLIKLESKGNIELYADKDIVLDAKEDIIIKAKKKIKENAGTDITIDAEKNITIEAKENISTTAGNNRFTTVKNEDTLNVTKSRFVEIGADSEFTVKKKHKVRAEDIDERASKELILESDTQKQKAKSSIEIDGGKNLGLHAKKLKFN